MTRDSMQVRMDYHKVYLVVNGKHFEMTGTQAKHFGEELYKAGALVREHETDFTMPNLGTPG
jgi:hypothetical protein